MKALGLYTGDPERGLAYVYRYSNPAQALRHAQDAVAEGPNNHQNHNCLGLILRDAGDHAAAFRAHERAAGLSANSAVTPFFLSLLRARQGAEERAISECHAAIYQLEIQEQRGSIKSIWADLIRWTERIFAGDYDSADRHLISLVDSCSSRRRAREVGGHIDFLLRSLQRETYRDRYLGPIEQRWPPVHGE